MELNRNDLEAVLFSDNNEVRAKFELQFSPILQEFLKETEATNMLMLGLGQGLKRDLRAAWPESLDYRNTLKRRR
jgi:hypothetical protein